ncbi:MAG: hypothetical protein ACM3O7_08595 [Acidobacteriota bacterium]
MRRASDGQLELQTATPFWSAFQPAAADVNDDGWTEFVVASGVRGCTACGLGGPLVFSQSGAVVWSSRYVATGPPVLIDGSLDSMPDVAMPLDEGSDDYQSMWLWEGRHGHYLPECGVGLFLERRPLKVLVIDSCVPHFLSGSRTVYGSIEFGAPQRGPEERTVGLDGDVIWSWEGPVELAAGATERMAQALDTQGQTGLFTFSGILRNDQQRTLARAETMFSVTQSDLELSIDPLEPEYKVNSSATLIGRLRNGGPTAVTVTLRIAVTYATPFEQTYTLAPGVEQPFSRVLPTAMERTHVVKVEVLEGATPVANGELRYEVVTPDVEATVINQKVANATWTPFVVHVKNVRHFAIDITASLDVVGQNNDPPIPLHLGPEEAADIVSMETFYRTNRLILRIRGDVSRDVSATIGVIPPPIVELASPPIFPAGASVLRLRLHSPATELFAGELSWSIAAVPGCSGTVDLRLAPDETVELGLPVDLPPGHFTLSAQVGSTQASFPIDTYVGGRGSFAVALPDRVTEGLIEVPVAITNLLPADGTFAVHAEVDHLPSGERAATEDRSWALGASASLSESIPIVLPAGDYRLTATLNGDTSTRVTRSFSVLSRFATQLDAALQALQPDGTLPVAVSVANAGIESLPGTLVLEGIGPRVVAPLAVPAGGTQELVLPLHADSLTTGTIPLSLTVSDGAGLPLAARVVTVTLLPATLQLQAAPTIIEASAGGVAQLDLSITNGGHQSAPVQVLADLAEGAIAVNSTTTRAAGGAITTVGLPLPLPDDLPAGTVPGRYRVLSQRGGPDTLYTVAEGRFAVRVAALPLVVDALLDRDHADAGETVILRVTLASPSLTTPTPMFLTTTYGASYQRQDVTVSSSPATVSFAVPIDEPGRALAFGVHSLTGRALHLDQRTIWPRTGDVVLTPDKEEYLPGDVVRLAVSLGSPGSFEAVGFEQSQTLQSSGTLEFRLPVTLPRGRYPIAWTFFRPGADGPRNGTCAIPVRGSLVRLTRLEASTRRARAGDVVPVHAEVLADVDLSVRLLAWLRAPSGAVALVADQPLQLTADLPAATTLDVPIETSEAGTHDIVVAVFTADDTSLAEGTLRLDVGSGGILGLEVGASSHPRVDAPLSAYLVAQGNGTGELALRLGRIILSTVHLGLSGVTRTELPLPPLEPDWYELDATLTVDGLTSSASVRFLVPPAPTRCALVSASPTTIWPADQAMVAISLASPTGPGPRPPGVEIVSVRQDEPVDTDPDEGIPGDATLSPLRVRAERAPSGDGRVYHITFRLLATQEQECTGKVTVCVPLTQGEPCVDGGALYDSTRR